MEEQANYIKRIEIHRLWDRFDIAWDLRPDVNILSGINGVGKTTILNRSVHYLEELSGEIKNGEIEGVRVTFDRPDATYIPYDVIRSYDRPLIMGDFTARMADPNVKSELDWQLYLLQRRYLDYQVNIGNKMIELLSGDEEQRSQAASLSLPKRKFQDLMDQLFSYTRKTIDRRSNEIIFYQDGERLLPYKLSSGEKQIICTRPNNSPDFLIGMPSMAIPFDLFFFRCMSILCRTCSLESSIRIWASSSPNRMISRSRLPLWDFVVAHI